MNRLPCLLLLAAVIGCGSETETVTKTEYLEKSDTPEAAFDKPGAVEGKRAPKEILDLADVKRNHPDWKVVEPEAKGGDPFSLMTSIYLTEGSKVKLLNFTSQMNSYRAQYDGRVPFEKVKELIDGAGLQFAPLPANQFLA